MCTLTVNDEHFGSNVIRDKWIWEEFEKGLQCATDCCVTVTKAVDVQVMIYGRTKSACMISAFTRERNTM